MADNPLLQEQWSSKWAFILAATGAAVGLGNVWRFPYMAGTHGGSAFVLMYIICVIILGLPIMMAEILIGRHSRKNPIDALRDTAVEAKKSKHWGLLGWWGALALIMVLSFYSVVSGWSIAYLIRTISGQFNGMNASQVHQVWGNFMASPWQMLGWHTLFMVLTIGVIVRGVEQGLEKSTKYIMPALYIVLFALVIDAGVTGNFKQAVHFLFDFKASLITPSVVVSAMGHAFFTLALGAGAMLTYGAYVPKGVNIAKAVAIVAGLDVLVAILSGLAIFPIVFAHHLTPTAGPGLMFESLPIAFAQMHGGMIVGSLFFLLLLFAAWTSSINLAEPLVIILMSRLKLKRKPAALLVGVFAWALGIGSLLSFNLWSHVRFFHHYTVFDVATNVPTDIILPIGGIGFALFAGWVMTRRATFKEIGSTSPTLYPLWRFLVRYIAPAGILVVFLSSFF